MSAQGPQLRQRRALIRPRSGTQFEGVFQLPDLALAAWQGAQDMTVKTAFQNSSILQMCVDRTCRTPAWRAAKISFLWPCDWTGYIAYFLHFLGCTTSQHKHAAVQSAILPTIS